MTDRAKFLTKKDYLVTAIKDAIFRGEIKPGEHLLQRELAERFETSVTPVREALRDLEKEGLVSHSPHRGVTVTALDPQEIQDICVVRVKLEELALERAFPNLTEGDFETLWEVHAETKQAYANQDWARVYELNLQLHLRIWRRAESPVLEETILLFWNRFPWYLMPALYERRQVLATEHEHFLTALQAGDLAAAKDILSKHILGWGEFLKKQL